MNVQHILEKSHARTRIVTGLALVLAIAGAVGLGGGGTTALADTSTSTPVISGVMATSTASGTGAEITWATDIPASSQVRYGTTTAYGTYSALTDTSVPVMNHAVALGDLIPNTTYHFSVLSTASSTTGSSTSVGPASSSDASFTTLASTTSNGATSTPPVVSTISVTPFVYSAYLTWQTDQRSSSRVAYGTTTAYRYVVNFANASSTSHAVTLPGLMPDTLYHFRITSTNPNGTGTTTDHTFTTQVASSTTGTTTIATLQTQIANLEERVAVLESEVAMLISNSGGGTGGTPTTTPPVSGSARIDQNNSTWNTGGSIDFGGHNFKSDEHVTVTLNGAVVGTAFADDGGNFSTGSLSLPSAPGTYTYVFTGERGDSATATLTLQ